MPSARVEVYDPTLNQWSYAAPMAIARFYAAAATAPDGTIFVVGGQSIYPSSEKFYPTTNTWTPVAATSDRREAAAAAGAGGRVYVLGGAFSSSIEAHLP